MLTLLTTSAPAPRRADRTRKDARLPDQRRRPAALRWRCSGIPEQGLHRPAAGKGSRQLQGVRVSVGPERHGLMTQKLISASCSLESRLVKPTREALAQSVSEYPLFSVGLSGLRTCRIRNHADPGPDIIRNFGRCSLVYDTALRIRPGPPLHLSGRVLPRLRSLRWRPHCGLVAPLLLLLDCAHRRIRR